MFTRRDASTPSQPGRDDTLGRADQPVLTPAAAPPSAPAPMAAPAPAPIAQAAGSANESLIAREDTFEGTLKTATGVRVQGTVRGGIESQKSVRIDAGAHVEADITADEVVIAGTYSGNLTCRNRAEITETGRVSGKIETVKLFLHEGGFLDGELHMQRPPEEAPAPRPAENDGLRARRSRYVDITSDNPRPAADIPGETKANDAGKPNE